MRGSDMHGVPRWKHTRQLWFAVHWRKRDVLFIFPYMNLISNKRFKRNKYLTRRG